MKWRGFHLYALTSTSKSWLKTFESSTCSKLMAQLSSFAQTRNLAYRELPGQPTERTFLITWPSDQTRTIVKCQTQSRKLDVGPPLCASTPKWVDAIVFLPSTQVGSCLFVLYYILLLRRSRTKYNLQANWLENNALFWEAVRYYNRFIFIHAGALTEVETLYWYDLEHETVVLTL